jgi:hypothetical protein
VSEGVRERGGGGGKEGGVSEGEMMGERGAHAHHTGVSYTQT